MDSKYLRSIGKQNHLFVGHLSQQFPMARKRERKDKIAARKTVLRSFRMCGWRFQIVHSPISMTRSQCHPISSRLTTTSTGPSTSPTVPNHSRAKPTAWCSFSSSTKNTPQGCSPVGRRKRRKKSVRVSAEYGYSANKSMISASESVPRGPRALGFVMAFAVEATVRRRLAEDSIEHIGLLQLVLAD